MFLSLRRLKLSNVLVGTSNGLAAPPVTITRRWMCVIKTRPIMGDPAID